MWYMEYYSATKKECIWVSCNEVHELRAYYTEWSTSEREKQIHINAYIWNLERWYWWPYLQGSNGDAVVQYRFVDIVGKGESSTETYVTICKIDSQWEFAIWCKELKPSILWQPREVGCGGREVQEGGDIRIPMYG